MTTRAMESIRVNCTSSTEERMVVVRSTTMPTWMAGGMDASNSGSRERMRSTVSIMLAAGWRKRMMSTAGLPLERPALRRSCTESATVATSESWTALPL